MEGPIKNEENYEGKVKIADRKILLDGKKIGVVALRDKKYSRVSR